MAEKRLSRRQIVKGAGVLGAVGALTALEDAAVAHADMTKTANGGIVGSWSVMSKPDGDRLLFSLLPGGVAITTRAGSTVFSKQHQNVTGTLHGAWVSTGPHTFSILTHEFRTLADGTFFGTGIVRENITLDKGLNTFTATWSFNFIHSDGSTGGSASGTLKGTRIKVK